ncbi:MAG: hypothetical protein J3Q66DRAFT_354166 [Benniella sp.]|nr:MAG: hypothetical protein J3Q66DRAFT_354166 [Benniella sp.]
MLLCVNLSRCCSSPSSHLAPPLSPSVHKDGNPCVFTWGISLPPSPPCMYNDDTGIFFLPLFLVPGPVPVLVVLLPLFLQFFTFLGRIPCSAHRNNSCPNMYHNQQPLALSSAISFHCCCCHQGPLQPRMSAVVGESKVWRVREGEQQSKTMRLATTPT